MRRSCRCVGLRSSRGACVRACACTRSTHLPRGMCVCGVRAGNGGTRGCSGKRTFRCSSTTTTTTGRGELLSGSCALFATTSLRARHAAPCTPSIARTLARPRRSSSAEQQPVPVARLCARQEALRQKQRHARGAAAGEARASCSLAALALSPQEVFIALTQPWRHATARCGTMRRAPMAVRTQPTRSRRASPFRT